MKNPIRTRKEISPTYLLARNIRVKISLSAKACSGLKQQASLWSTQIFFPKIRISALQALEVVIPSPSQAGHCPRRRRILAGLEGFHFRVMTTIALCKMALKPTRQPCLKRLLPILFLAQPTATELSYLMECTAFLMFQMK